MPRRLYPGGLLVLILLAALGARAYKLGAHSFWTDELYHVVAAQSLAETGTPFLPAYSGGQYTRAYPITYLTAVSCERFGHSEAAARGPFLLINMAFLVVAFFVVRRWFNAHLALIMVFVLASSPHELILGREVRMYGLFQLLYFSAAALLYAAIESGPGTRRRALALAGAAALLALSARVQLLTLNIAVSLAAYLAVMAVASGLRAGWRGLVTSRYVALLALLAAAGLAVVLVVPAVVGELALVARERPPWAADTPPLQFYSWFFLYYYPALTFLFPLGAVLLIRHHGRAGWFVACSFLPLMAAHLFLFTGRVEERYLSYLLPYFMIAACYPIQLALQPLLRHVAAEWRRGSRAIAVITALALLPASGVVGHTWLRESQNLLRWGYGPNWKTVAPTLRALATDCVVMTPWPLHMAYYSGSFPDYILRKKQPEDGEGPLGQLGSRSVPLRWLYDAEEFARIVAEEPEVCVIMTEWAYNNDAYVDPSLRAAMERLLVKRAHPGDEKVIIYGKRR